MASRKFMDEMLSAHNNYRSTHGAPPLRLNNDLSNMAQNWANQLARTNTFQHSKNRSYRGQPVGENLAMSYSSTGDEYTGHAATQQWYDEVKQYNYRTSSGPGTGHFTQVVWKDSQEIGIGKAQTRDGKWMVCANYFPAGNFIGRYAENVLPSGSRRANHVASEPTYRPTAPKSESKFLKWLGKGPRGWFSSSKSTPSKKESPTVTVHVTNTREHLRPTVTSTPKPNNVTSSTFTTRNEAWDRAPFLKQTTVVREANSSPHWFSHSASKDPQTTVVRETNSRPNWFSHSAAKDPQTTVVLESNSRPHISSHSAAKVPQATNYSRTVVTKTVIGPNGQKTVTTEETVNSDGNGAAFNQLHGSSPRMFGRLARR